LQDVESRFKSTLESRLPQFDWRIAISRRRDIAESGREESSELLRLATEERDLYRWDFAIILVNEELLAHYRAFALAVLSRPLDAAVVSTARLIPDVDGPGADHDQPDESAVIERIVTLLLRAVAHLGGLRASKDPQSLLYRPTSPADLTSMKLLSCVELDELTDNLTEVADLRLEESTSPREKPSAWRFLLRASYINREQILETIVAARPWQFPRRLSRLTTAAVSTVAVLLLSAESWDLGLMQSWTSLASISLLILLFTTVFISVRQHLLLSRSSHHREQIAATRVSAIGIVLSGLALTWACMFALALLASSLLFSPDLIIQWAGSQAAAEHAITAVSYLKMATFCASLGLLIGALGASFEDQTHFQHVIFVDEEL
jgi:predicted Zn-dependent protease